MLALTPQGWLPVTAISITPPEHAALRVALEDTRTGGVATRRGLTVEHRVEPRAGVVTGAETVGER